MVIAAIDLNADLAEEAGDDEALYPFLQVPMCAVADMLVDQKQ